MRPHSAWPRSAQGDRLVGAWLCAAAVAAVAVAGCNLPPTRDEKPAVLGNPRPIPATGGGPQTSGGPDKPTQPGAPRAAGAPAPVSATAADGPQRPSDPARASLVEAALRVHAYSKLASADAIAASLLDDKEWPHGTGRSISLDKAAKGGPLYTVPVGPGRPETIVRWVGWLAEERPFRVQRVELWRDGQDWEGNVDAVAITFDPDLEGAAARKAEDGLHTWESQRSLARRTLAASLETFALTHRLTMVWYAGGEYEVLTSNVEGRDGQPRPTTETSAITAEDRARVRLEKISAELFPIDALAGARGAVQRILEDAAAQAGGVRILNHAPPAPPFPIGVTVPAGLGVQAVLFNTALEGDPEIVAAAMNRVDDSRRAAVGLIHSDLDGKPGAAAQVDVALDALGVSPTQAAAGGAEAGLRQIETFVRERPRLGPIVAAAAALRPGSARSVRVWATWSRVTIVIVADETTAGDYSVALQSSPAFDRYKLASVGFASDGYHIDFASKR